MKIYLFDLDWVIINSETFTYWIQKKFWINKNFLDIFFIKDFSDCLIWKKDLKKTIKPYLDNSEWKFWIDQLLNFWFNFENKPNLELLSIIKNLKKNWNICCIVSNQEKYRANFIKNTMKIWNNFDEIFFSCDLWVKKPDLDFFNIVYKKLKDKYWDKYWNLNKKDIYFYDDDVKNIENWNNFWFNSQIFNQALMINF